MYFSGRSIDFCVNVGSLSCVANQLAAEANNSEKMATAAVDGDSASKLPTAKVPTFKRVFQACANCRAKKHRCHLDPISPQPPCLACSREGVACIFPEKKRKGRPPGSSKGRSSTFASDHPGSDLYDSSAQQHFSLDPIDHTLPNDTANAPDLVEWQSFMSSMQSNSGTAGLKITGGPSHYSGQEARHGGYSSVADSPLRNTTSLEERLASEALAAFSVRNTSDAVRLLDQAEPKKGRSENQDQIDMMNGGPSNIWPTTWQAKGKGTGEAKVHPPFFLLQEGILDQATLCRLFRFYLGSAHPIMPLIPYKRLPLTPAQIEALAREEQHLMSAIMVISAALEGDYDLHDRLWERVRTLFSDVTLQGEGASLGAIEGLLLLSEYPPRRRHEAGFVPEDRMCWMTVGAAVRLAYLLGLEHSSVTLEEDFGEKAIGNRDRGRVAWIYCYILDRQTAIRAGKSFSCRGPGLTPQSSHPDPAQDFPELQHFPGVQDDYASYLQCQVDLTLTMSNAHDVLYPSRSRSLVLAKSEQYYKFIDDFCENLAFFRRRWSKKTWQTYPINECVWISFHYVRLYIYAFSFQAHMQRVQTRNASLGVKGAINYFPSGLMGCSDARYILEAIDAAADVIRLAIGRLQPAGGLAYLPLRFFLLMNHAGVFLLKASVVVPLPSPQKRAILRLIYALTKGLSTLATHKHHPGARHSAALARLLQKVHHDLDLQSPNPTRAPSPTFMPPLHETIFGNRPEPYMHGNTNGLFGLSSGQNAGLTPFVAERPFQDLAAEMDAQLGDQLNFSVHNTAFMRDNRQQSASSATLAPADPLASLFNGDESGFWETFGACEPDWNMIQGV